MIGKLFNQRYQIVEKLGAGGTAIVYRGQDTLLNRSVTIKILREEYASNQEFVRRFRHEAQAVASLSHPNIVGVYDVGFEENMHYIVMEFVEGESLKEYIRRKGMLKLSEACNIITQILSGVEHAHEHGVIHRDIKPHNILLGKDGRAKVTDFGIAVGISDVTLTYNTSSRIMGSVHYISPEQVQGLAVTEKSDIYSVGVVFYEMLTGRLPFVGETPISIAMQHVQGELILPHQVNPEVPMGISYVVMRAMRKNPETRYANAAEMAEAVAAAYQGSLEPPEESAAEEAPALSDNRSHQPRNRRPRAGDYTYAEDESAPNKRRLNASRLALLAAAVVLVVGIVWVAGQVVDYFQQEEAKAIVPHVVGMTLEEAQAALTAEGLEALVITKNSSVYEAGIVMAQSIAKDQEVSPGRSIEITVSEGEPQVTVPNLSTTSQTIAELTLANLGLVAVINEEYNDEVPKGEVILQHPAAGSRAPVGSSVQLLFSLGKEPVKFVMSDLLGKTLEEALAYINEKELELGITTPSASYEYEANRIISQSIAANSEAQTGDKIDLGVSEGPGPVLKMYAVEFLVPEQEDEDGDLIDVDCLVVITVADSKETREVFNQILTSGTLLNYAVEYYNQATITVSVDGVAMASYTAQ